MATIEAVFASPINFIDTSNGYGVDAAAERRIGLAIGRHCGLPGGAVLATKVDPDPRTGGFSGERVRASLEESMERLGLDQIQLLHLHQLRDGWTNAAIAAPVQFRAGHVGDARDGRARSGGARTCADGGARRPLPVYPVLCHTPGSFGRVSRAGTR